MKLNQRNINFIHFDDNTVLIYDVDKNLVLAKLKVSDAIGDFGKYGYNVEIVANKNPQMSHDSSWFQVTIADEFAGENEVGIQRCIN